MTRDPWQAALEIAEEAFAEADGERDAFVAHRCRGDAVLLCQVENLLRADGRAERFLADSPAERLFGAARDDEEDGKDAGAFDGARKSDFPEQVGPYRLLRRLGKGGMGEVFEAEQRSPVRRRVALKLIKRGMDSREVVARFESERQALALMSHPHIARFFDVGTSAEGRPYFVLELVDGLPITEYCDRNLVSIEERIALMIAVCEGVRHAHQKGVIHRDLKPSNLLVTVEGEHRVPKIIDFGVAKAMHSTWTEAAAHTALGQWVGTPEYMSPEQAALTGPDVDTRSDVYSLGVVLYELLTGVLPIAWKDNPDDGFDAFRRRVREQDPPSPSLRFSRLGPRAVEVARARQRGPGALARRLQGDLDWIVAKALDKDRSRRYGSPAELAADLRRHLAQQPVLARPPSFAYRAGKLVRRHRLPVAAAAVIGLALALAVMGITLGAIRAQREADSARQVAATLEDILGGLDPGQPMGRASMPSNLLSRSAERIGHQLADQPLVRARLLGTVGRISRNLALYDQARPVLEEALALEREELGPDHVRVAAALHDLGWLAFQTGDYATARQHFEAALDIHERALGPDHPEVGRSLDDLSVVLWRMGELRAAKPLTERALGIFRRLGKNHPRVGDALYHRGMVLSGLDERPEALGSLRQALEIYQLAYGVDHPVVGWLLVDLGVLLRRMDGSAAARPLFERALKIQQESFGPEHPNVSFPLVMLGYVQRALGEPDTARATFERTLAIRQKSMGLDHPEVAGPLVGLGLLARDDGDDARARALLERALALTESGLGTSHPDLVWILSPLAAIAYDEGDLGQARRLFERGLGIVERIVGASHLRTGTWLYNLACVAALSGERAQALAYLRRAVDNGHVYRGYADDPDLDLLRGDAEFERLVARAGRPTQNR